ncbi:hypothetical protein VTN77DRAFT_1285 [Rasamsonia byssochlamydoides]|uniref:uncharacterized protein n=1 Tax=Rasamsonia byssochlamydoides TaxID=89139 RepID=UPI0037424129
MDEIQQEILGERVSRVAGNLPRVEEDLPSRWSRRTSAIWAAIRAITFFLGRRNPLAQPANPEQHIVWLFDNIAYRPVHPYHNEPQSWQVEVVSCVFVDGRKDLSRYVAAVADAIGLDGKVGLDEVTRQRMAYRLRPFVYSIAPARTMTLEIPMVHGTVQKQELGPTNRHGVISQTLRTDSRHDVSDGTTITSYLAGWGRKVSMDTIFATPEGWPVISDIDDSIKYTKTSEATGVLRTTFAEEPKPIEGMPESYAHIHKQLRPAWIYLSASPYNLYEYLREFLRSYYIPGTLILRENSWMGLGGFLNSYTQGTQAYKMDRIDKVHSWFPQRKIICVGDSTQSDPEIYAGMYKKYPGWIHAILIRKVTNIPHMEKKNSDERFRKAFDGVPEGVWKVFERTEELYELVDGLKTRQPTGSAAGVHCEN